ncbi:integrase family protein [Burkholderia contaminans]|uniref:tyrosine-type recombinase/integrase n=1 Tax=Burkholderia contaminans TaxID=488447 RepID=UPI001453D4BC|nr:tyrosine-type recombinase/integrase [Burkholderia contaminans]VWD37450.1 integrase family protein [Burkholderia contaminans]
MTTEVSLVLIRPIKDFESFEYVRQIVFGGDESGFTPRYFDVPLLAIVVDRSMTPIWTPTLYLADCALRGRSITGDTVRSYAEALLTWLQYLEELKIDFGDVTEDDLAAFRNLMVHRRRSNSGRPLSSATANHRISVVCNFYIWGQLRGDFKTKLGEYLEDRRKKLVGYSRIHINSRDRPIRSLAPAVMQRLPRLLTREELVLLFREVSGVYKLIFKWALVTGLRRFEICNLEVSQLPSPEKIAFFCDRFAPVDISRKGGRNVTVYVPISLIEETRWHVLTERRQQVRGGGEKVFIGKRGAPVDRGSVSREFRRCADKIGSDSTFHHLRHTFAINVLEMLERNSRDGDPLNTIKTLQVLLGHASIESTEIYLRAMEVSSEHVMDALDYLYGATL